MRALILIGSIFWSLAAPAMAQWPTSPLLDRLTAIDVSKAIPSACNAQMARATYLNGPDLLYASAICRAAKMPVEGNFLLNAGQVRAMSDLSLMVPATKADSDLSTGLYGVLYFHAGGPGDEAVLRQAGSLNRLFSLFDGWSPDYTSDYDPGWRMRRKPDVGTYRTAIKEMKTARRKQLVDAAKMASDAAYASLARQLDELKARNPAGFIVGTVDERVSSQLLRQMTERAAVLTLGGAAVPRRFDERSDAAERFPPAGLAAEESVIGNTGPVATRCADLAERMTIAQESKIAAVLVTRSAKWGTIWRADLAAENRPMERLTCTATTTSSRPLSMGADTLAPLPR